MKLKHHKAMWCNGHKFHIKKLDNKKKTFDCSITAIFQVTNVSYRSGSHLEVDENKRYGYLNDILDVTLNSLNYPCSRSNGTSYECIM
jgi:hypothetical protein